MKILCKKTGCILHCEDEGFLGLTNGEYSVEIKKTRNPRFNKKYFSLLNLIFENQSVYDNFEELRIEIKFLIGHYATHVTHKGKIIYIPLSTSFDSVDEIEFEKIYSKTLDVAFSHFITGSEEDKNRFTNELSKFL